MLGQLRNVCVEVLKFLKLTAVVHQIHTGLEPIVLWIAGGVILGNGSKVLDIRLI